MNNSLTISWETVEELQRFIRKQYLSPEYFPLVHRMMRDIYDLQCSGTETGYYQGTVETAEPSADSAEDLKRRRDSEALLSPEERGTFTWSPDGYRVPKK